MIEKLEALHNNPEKDGVPQPGERDEGKGQGDNPSETDGSPA